MKKLTAEWVRKAEDDYRAVKMFARSREVLHDLQCFHSQQCAEKYLKALLQELGLPVPRTHNLVALLDLLLPHHGSLRSLRRGLNFLTGFAVGPRYPAYTARKRQAVSARRWGGSVREACRKLLRLRPPRRRKSP